MPHIVGPSEHADASQVVISVIGQIGKCLSLQARGHAEVHNMLPVSKAHIIADQGIVEHLCDMLSALALGMDDPVCPKLGQDAMVVLGCGLCPDCLYANGLEVDCRKNAGLDIGADRDDADIGRVNAGFAQSPIIAGIKNESMREIFGIKRNVALICVNADDVVSKPLKVARQRAAESSQSNYHECLRISGHSIAFSHI